MSLKINPAYFGPVTLKRGSHHRVINASLTSVLLEMDPFLVGADQCSLELINRRIDIYLRMCGGIEETNFSHC